MEISLVDKWIACAAPKAPILARNASMLHNDVGDTDDTDSLRRFEWTEIAIVMVTETDQSVTSRDFGHLFVGICLCSASRQGTR